MKILILVLTYLDNGIYSSFYEKQNETWNSLSVENIDTFFYINGGSEKKIDGHFIVNDLPENVANEGFKMINSFEKTLSWDYDYIFHTNSSSYIDKKLLYQWLSDKPRNKFYSGVVGYHKGVPFASGSGFSISKDVVNLILENQSKWEHYSCDDATLGVLLNNLKINVTPALRFIVEEHTGIIPDNFFHYRCHTQDRKRDILNFDRIHSLKI